jgi:lipopolysaccharide transport system permease protein
LLTGGNYIILPALVKIIPVQKTTMPQKLIIEAGRAEKNYWKDIWHYRELFYILSWRDIKVRYKQTVIGALWGVLRPVLTMLVFVFAFGRVGGLAKDSSVPYPLLVFSGLLPWQFFATALSEASNSVITNASLVSKVYFPRIIVPASSIITSLVDFFITFLLLVIMMVFYLYQPPAQIFLLPFFIMLSLMASLGIGLYITALNVKYRDFRYIVPFIVQLGIYVSPVGYSSTKVASEFGERARLIYSMNPMVGVIDGFRWCITGEAMYWPGLGISVAITLLFLYIGIRYFRKTEKSFADNI